MTVVFRSGLLSLNGITYVPPSVRGTTRKPRGMIVSIYARTDSPVTTTTKNDCVHDFVSIKALHKVDDKCIRS